MITIEDEISYRRHPAEKTIDAIIEMYVAARQLQLDPFTGTVEADSRRENSSGGTFATDIGSR